MLLSVSCPPSARGRRWSTCIPLGGYAPWQCWHWVAVPCSHLAIISRRARRCAPSPGALRRLLALRQLRVRLAAVVCVGQYPLRV